MFSQNSNKSSIQSLVDWAKYSGASIVITVNPWHWRWTPWFREETNQEWPSPNERTWALGFLFLTLRVWIDDGAW